MSIAWLREEVERLAAMPAPPHETALPVVRALLDALEAGEVRAAEPAGDGWAVNAWVKQGILVGFRLASNLELDLPAVFHFRDRSL